jgi:CelD/BcsL family acetyltransferase involved in cellulose biosynthesis
MSRTHLQIDVVRTDSALEALRPEWERLYEAASPQNPFLSWGWTAACRAHHCPRAGLYLHTAREHGELVAVAPLRIERQLGLRVLRFLGDGRSDYLGFLSRADRPDLHPALLDALKARSGEWDLAVLRHVSDVYSPLSAASVPERIGSAEIEGTVAPFLRFPGDWAELCANGPSQIRHTKRPARKFEKEDGTVQRVTGPEAAAYVEEIAAVEARSWKGEKGCARFQPGAGQELLRRALAELGAREAVELWIARLEERPIAFLINFLTPDRVCYYQGAYDEELRRYYAGGVLHYRAMERAWTAGLREYDFMCGDEGYKNGWTNGVRSVRYVALYPETLRGRLAFAALVAPRWKLKGSQTAHAALRLWVQLRNSSLGRLREAA